MHFSADLESRATSPENKIRWRLDESRIKYRFQYPFQHSSGFYILDFYLPSLKVCIEVDGGYHLSPDQIEKDRIRDEFLLFSGIGVARFTNEEAVSLSKRNFLKRVRAASFKYNHRELL